MILALKHRVVFGSEVLVTSMLCLSLVLVL